MKITIFFEIDSGFDLRVIIGPITGQIIDDVYIRQAAFYALVLSCLIKCRIVKATQGEAEQADDPAS